MTTSAQAPHRTPHPHLLSARLHEEWTHVRHSRSALARAAGWAIVEGPIADLDQVLAAVGYATAWSPAGESALRRLVARAAHDELAARVVIQRILPGLIATACRRRATDDALHELLGAAWISIRTYNPARQTRCIAGALISDADYRAFRVAWRKGSAGELALGIEPDLLAVQAADDDSGAALAVVLERAVAAGLAERDVELIRRLACDIPTAELARSMQVTPRTIRNRRKRITQELRRLAAAA